jgi:hypothetical protein
MTMTMRPSRFWSLVLAAMLLAGQHAALLHAIGHVAHPVPSRTLATASHATDDQPAESDRCVECIAYAPLAAFVVACGIDAAASVTPSFLSPLRACVSPTRSPRLAFHARAPPSAS